MSTWSVVSVGFQVSVRPTSRVFYAEYDTELTLIQKRSTFTPVRGLLWLYRRIISPSLHYSRPETELAPIIGTTVAMSPSNTGLHLPYFPGTRPSFGQLGGDDAIVALLAPSTEIGRRTLSKREKSFLCPIFERNRQPFILGTLDVHSNLNAVVELPENSEPERHACDLKLAQFFPT
jgi:hypothetical protein